MIKIDIIQDVMWERLPVMKIIEYPIEQREYKPFAQSQICYKINSGIVVKMWAFEVDPLSKTKVNNDEKIFNDSILSLVISNEDKNRRPRKSIIISINKLGAYFFQYSEDNIYKKINDDLKVETFGGEDLQGIYWGVYFLVTNEILDKYLGVKQVEGDNKLYINFIKSCNESNHRHCGGVISVKENWVKNLIKAVIR